MLLKQLNGELLVAVDHSQLWTMASQTVDQIDWPLSPTLHRAVPHELHVVHGAYAGYKSPDLLQPVRIEHATFGMPGQRTAYAATLGTKKMQLRTSSLAHATPNSPILDVHLDPHPYLTCTSTLTHATPKLTHT